MHSIKEVIGISKIVFGFDIDGVLTDDDNGYSNIWIQRASDYFNRPILRNSYYIDEALGLAQSEIVPFLRDETVAIFETVPVRQGCAEVISRLHHAGHDIQLITARSEPYRAVTEKWLRQNRIPFTDLHMNSAINSSYSKGEKCRTLGVRFFVDDHFENCTDIARQGVYTLLYHASHNKAQECPPEITRVYSWMEIAEHIRKLTR